MNTESKHACDSSCPLWQEKGICFNDDKNKHLISLWLIIEEVHTYHDELCKIKFSSLTLLDTGKGFSDI